MISVVENPYLVSFTKICEFLGENSSCKIQVFSILFSRWSTIELSIDINIFSFDLGPVHWVGVSTENYGFYYAYGQEPVFTQYNWLKNDLDVKFK